MRLAWKILVCLIAVGGIFLSYANAQSELKEYVLRLPDGYEVKTLSPYYNAAYLEMAAMLDGRQELSVKRAVFLVEWAFLDGKPDYTAFCDSIASIASTLKDFIKLNKLDQHPLGGNIAVFEYMCNPSPLNGFKEYTYDFEDFWAKEDHTKLFVTKLMHTRSGQCHSLPLLYKILANEIGAEAYLAYAPNHSFIRHKNEDGSKWMNVELTNHSLPREIFIIETMGITEKAIEKGTYLKPCDDRQIVINMLGDLVGGYIDWCDYIDGFVELCLGTIYKYDSGNLLALMTENNCLYRIIPQYKALLDEKGLPDDDHLNRLIAQSKEVMRKIDDTGYVDMPKDLYEDWVKSVQDEIDRRKANGLRIK